MCNSRLQLGRVSKNSAPLKRCENSVYSRTADSVYISYTNGINFIIMWNVISPLIPTQQQPNILIILDRQVGEKKEKERKHDNCLVPADSTTRFRRLY
jgi:hypothetical protein